MGGEVHLDIYDDRLALTSPGGMYSGQMVQDVPVEDISSLRRNPVLADVMAQLDYMEKRGSGLKKICNATKELETYKEGRDPVFKVVGESVYDGDLLDGVPAGEEWSIKWHIKWHIKRHIK